MKASLTYPLTLPDFLIYIHRHISLPTYTSIILNSHAFLSDTNGAFVRPLPPAEATATGKRFEFLMDAITIAIPDEEKGVLNMIGKDSVFWEAANGFLSGDIDGGDYASVRGVAGFAGEDGKMKSELVSWFLEQVDGALARKDFLLSHGLFTAPGKHDHNNKYYIAHSRPDSSNTSSSPTDITPVSISASPPPQHHQLQLHHPQPVSPHIHQAMHFVTHSVSSTPVSSLHNHHHEPSNYELYQQHRRTDTASSIPRHLRTESNPLLLQQLPPSFQEAILLEQERYFRQQQQLQMQMQLQQQQQLLHRRMESGGGSVGGEMEVMSPILASGGGGAVGF